jgi:hypothetical protein
MGVSIILKTGLVEKQNIGDVYEDRNLPASLAKLPARVPPVRRWAGNLYRKTTTKYF